MLFEVAKLRRLKNYSFDICQKNKIAHKFFVDELNIYVLAKALTFPTKKVGLKPDSIENKDNSIIYNKKLEQNCSSF